MKNPISWHAFIGTLALASVIVLPSSSFAAQFTVSSASQMTTALDSVNPGDEIIIQDGTYQGWGTITIQSGVQGTSTDPITIRAETAGNVVFTGNDVHFDVLGNYIIFKGLIFENKTDNDNIFFIEGGQNNRITECTFRKISGSRIIWIFQSGGSPQPDHNRLDHCVFRDNTGSEAIDVRFTDTSTPFGTRIDHNLFRDLDFTHTNDPYVRLGTSRNYASFDSGAVIEDNMIINCVGGKDFLHHKISGVIHRRNRFEDSSFLSFRHGRAHVFESNVVKNIKTNAFAMLRVSGKDHRIVNNVFIGGAEDNPDWPGRWNKGAVTLEYGVSDGIEHYTSVSGCLIAHNTIVDLQATGIFIGAFKDAPSNTGTRSQAPYDNTIYNNIIWMSSGTLIAEDSAPDNLISHNLLYATGNANLGVQGSHAVIGDPLFVDPAARSASGYALLGGSPAIDSALSDITTSDYAGGVRPYGLAADIGAFEYRGDDGDDPVAPAAPQELRIVEQ